MMSASIRRSLVFIYVVSYVQHPRPFPNIVLSNWISRGTDREGLTVSKLHLDPMVPFECSRPRNSDLGGEEGVVIVVVMEINGHLHLLNFMGDVHASSGIMSRRQKTGTAAMRCPFFPQPPSIPPSIIVTILPALCGIFNLQFPLFEAEFLLFTLLPASNPCPHLRSRTPTPTHYR